MKSRERKMKAGYTKLRSQNLKVRHHTLSVIDRKSSSFLCKRKNQYGIMIAFPNYHNVFVNFEDVID